MKLIILIAIVALANADDSPQAFQACFQETVKFQECMKQEVKDATMRNFKNFTAFHTELAKCFEQDGIKGVCTPPPSGMPEHMMANFQHGSTGAPPTMPPQEFLTCAVGAKKAFFTCFVTAAGIPKDFKPEGLPDLQAHPGPQGPPPQMQHQFAHEKPEDMKAKMNEHCNNNAAAVEKLSTCVKAAIAPHMHALMAFKNPMFVACRAGAVCNSKQPFSDDCKSKMVKAIKGFCDCRAEVPKYVEGSCSDSARSAFKQYTEANTAQTGVAVTNIPNHPEHPMDFCGSDHQNVCKEMHEKLAKIHADHGLPAPAPAASA